MIDTYSFGEWVKQRRQSLRRTQREIAAAVYCSVAMIKKIEADERQPSPELAQALATALDIPAEQHAMFVECARGEQPVDRLNPTQPPASRPPSFAPPLPRPMTPFIGRQAELTAITHKLNQPGCRLLTLLGPGGMGKTRLAIEAARAIQDNFSDGALFVPLSTVTDFTQISTTIAQTLHLPLAGSDPPYVQIQRLLRRRHLLLLLDNFEQLVSGADLLSDLLVAAPNLKLMVTSRERLNLVEEWLYPIPALAEAVALFEATAVRVKPDFTLDTEDLAVTRICQLVAGHPLAVELAASWSRFMACQQIAAKIEQDLDFLASPSRNIPERHHSLRALFDHSWALLTPAEQNVLAKLTVFRGGFAPEEAAATAGASWPILLGLVDKSLVVAQGDNRFDLHPLMQQYAAQKLAEAGAEPATQQAHFEAFCDLARQLNALSIGPQAVASFRRAEREYDNFRAALSWGLANQQNEIVLKLLHNLFEFWLPAGYWPEGERWTTMAVAQAGDEDSVYLCLALSQLGVFVALQGRFPEAAPQTQRAYQMARRLEEPWPLAFALQIQGQALPDKATALAAFEEAIAICQDRVNEPQFATRLGRLLRLQGDRLKTFGMLTEAKAKYEESLARFRQVGDTSEIAYPLGNLGRIALYEGDLQKAHDLISESVTIARNAGNRVAIGDWIFRLGQVQYYLGQWAAAEANLQETMQLYEDVGNRFGPPGVLSNLALVALEREDVALAAGLIRESLNRYRHLQEAMSKVDRSVNLLEFGDTVESLLQAGLVAYTLKEWEKALSLFRFVEKNAPGYATIQPLQDKVLAAEADIKTYLSPAAFAAAITKGERLTVNELLAVRLK
ncbi:MAG: helix-turn-helix domain-containing protein [Anaerolineae bacterium]|nr:helix-turn-helix domain-containing protein [Anaerolineae bacterium]